MPASRRGEPRCLVVGCSFSVRLTPKMLSLQPCLSQAWGSTRFKYGLAHFLALWSCSATMGVPFPPGSSSTTMNLRPLGTSTTLGQSESERERSSRTGNSRESMYPFLDTLPLLLLLADKKSSKKNFKTNPRRPSTPYEFTITPHFLPRTLCFRDRTIESSQSTYDNRFNSLTALLSIGPTLAMNIQEALLHSTISMPMIQIVSYHFQTQNSSRASWKKF
jgi:hypothetical protein